MAQRIRALRPAGASSVCAAVDAFLSSPRSAATILGEQGVPLQLIMAKTRHKNPRTAMRYIEPGATAVAEVTELLQPPRRRG